MLELELEYLNDHAVHVSCGSCYRIIITVVVRGSGQVSSDNPNPR